MRALLAGPVLALALASGCAHGASWDRADLARLSFDGEDPSMVRIVANADTLYMPHPVMRGDSLVGRYGYGEAVALTEIDNLETHDGQASGMSAAGAIGLGLLAALIALSLVCAGEDYIC